MPFREVAGRLSYAAFCARERRLHRQRRLGAPVLREVLTPSFHSDPDWLESARRAAWSALRRALPLIDDPIALRTLFEERYARERALAVEEAERVLGGRIRFFGHAYQYSETVDWHADPTTGRQWPIVYHRDVPSTGGNSGYGDIKHVWELNRHQFFVDLAKGFALTGDARYVARLDAWHASWCQQNPYGTGVSWSCALEPAFRAFSWLWSYALCEHAWTPSSRERWLTSFHDCGHFLHRHLEYYTSPFNHLIGEATALFLLGTYFPCFAEAAAWRARARAVLESTIGQQFHADGGSVEQSTFYHHATLGFYLLASLAADRGGEPLSPRIRTQIERALEFSMTLQQPDGRVPTIGGADDGKPIRFEHVRWFDFRAYLSIGAVLFGRGDFKGRAGHFWEDALWLLGADGLRRFDEIDARSTPVSAAVPESGYVVLRQPSGGEEQYLCFDCGPQAAGLRRDDAPSAAHGHADCLSLVLWLSGRPVLVDSGFFCYNGAPPWEVHFRKTRAHNTLEIDGQDQAQHVNKMAWCRTYLATLHGWGADGGGWARGSHDGYGRLPSPVQHERTVGLRAAGYAVVLDRLVGRGRHGVTVHYHFAPGSARLGHDGRSVQWDDHAELSWVSHEPFTPTVVPGGGPNPEDGWIAESLEVARSAPRLALEASALELPCGVGTVIAATSAGVRVRRLEESTSGAVLEISADDTVEWLEFHDLDSERAGATFWRPETGGWLGHTLTGTPDTRPAPAILSRLTTT